MNETRKTYGELKIGDIIYWYGALVRIVKINRVNCEKEDCTYFTIEPYNVEAIRILGEFYAHGTYGGINKLSVITIN